MFGCSVKAGKVTYRKVITSDKSIWSNDEIIMQPFRYAEQLYDIEYWNKLLDAFNSWIKAPEDIYKEATKTFKDFCVLFNIWNDICENRSKRNGKPTTHNKHGLPETLTSALFVAALSETSAPSNMSDAIPIVIEAILEVNTFLMLQVKYRNNCVCPTEDIFQTACSKFSNLFKAAIKVLQHYSSESKLDFDHLIEIFSAYFLIAEDYKYFCNKNVEDEDANEEIILENFPYPLTHVINNNENEGEAILDVIRQRNNNPEPKKWVIHLTKKLGGLEHTRNKLQKLRESAEAEAKRFDSNPLIVDFIETSMTAHLY